MRTTLLPTLLSKYFICILCSSLALSIGCKKEAEPPKLTQRIAPPKPQPKPIDTLRFGLVAIDGFSSLVQLESGLGIEKMFLVLKLNRLDRKHIRDNDTLVIPTVFDDRLSPFPVTFEAAKEITKLIIVSRRVQAFAAYDSGRLVRWGPTSTGKKRTPTPDGLYAANWKKELATSTVDPAWLLPWCVNIHNTEGISLHQFDLPGYPASHSCIRLLEEDAKWIFDWVDTWRLTKDARGVLAFGTPVIVYDEYPFGAPLLRKRIIQNRAAHFVARASLDSILAIYRATIIDRQAQRLQLMAMDSSKTLTEVP